MKKFLKICATTGLCMAVAGGIFLAAGLFLAGREALKGGLDGISQQTVQLEEADIENLKISVKAGSVILEEGNQFRLLSQAGESFHYEIKDSTLFIEEENRETWSGLEFFGIHITRDGIYTGERRVLLEVPEGTVFQNVDIDVKAGNFEADFLCTEGKAVFEAGAGNIEVEHFSGRETEIDCQMGNISIIGDISGDINADCETGALFLDLEDAYEKYRYSGSVQLGEVTIGPYSLEEMKHRNTNGEYEMQINCKLGAVDVVRRER